MQADDEHPEGRLPVLRTHWRVLTVALVGFVVTVPIFIRMSSVGVNSDILDHAEIARREIADGRWFTYTAYYPLIYGLSLGEHLVSLRTASVGLLAFAVAAKVVVVDVAARRWGASARASLAIAATSIVFTPLIALGRPVLHAAEYESPLFGAIYLGQFSATVWHNSTMIASLPLVLLAALFARWAIENPTMGATVSAGAAMVACALMKPNYVLAALPVLALVLVGNARRLSQITLRRAAALCLVFAGPSAAVFLLEVGLVRSNPNIVPSTFTLDPMAVWRYYSSSPLRSLTLSVAFPLVATAVVIGLQRRVEMWLWATWAVFGVAVLQLAMLGERNRVTGEPIFDGNWFWGPHAATLVLFVAAGAALSQATRVSNDAYTATGRSGVIRRGAPIFAWCVLGAHTVSGIVYIWRLFAFRNGFAT